MSILLLVATASGAGAQAAQDRDPLAKLELRTRYDVWRLLDSARIAGLPARPIESTVLQGISKRADDRRILMAARTMYKNLRVASVALGERASEAELTAGASALQAGITQAELGQLAKSHRDKQLTVPLVVLTDLITRGVPRDTSFLTIFQLWQRGASDDDFSGLWRGVERDIVSGTDPGMALLNRAREIPTRGPPPVAPAPAGARPPEESETRNR